MIQHKIETTKIVRGKEVRIKQKGHRINQPLDATNTTRHFLWFQGVQLISSNPLVLSLFKPPNGKLIQGLIPTIIELLRSRVFNVRAFDELISSHRYRLRNPTAFIYKFFVFYSSQPHTGNSCLAQVLSWIYGDLAMPTAKVENIEDQFNSWQTTMLMIDIEELQNENYQNHHFETTVKQMTTKATSSRAMHCETKNATNQAIIRCNTNKSDLYGLIRLIHLQFRA
jgi:hypothetical protein